MLSGLGQRHVKKGSQSAASPDLSPCPRRVIGPLLSFRDVEVRPVQGPDRIPFGDIGQVEKKQPIKAFCPRKLRWQLVDVVAGADKEDIGFVVSEPRKQTS